MVKSMTGYGRAKKLAGTKDIMFEFKSVNSRYLDVTVKMPRTCGALEDRVKQLLSGYVTRAKVEVYVSIDDTEGNGTELSVNRDYLESFLASLSTIKNDYGVGGEVSIDTVASRSDVFIQKKTDEDMEALWALMEPVAKEALENYNAMRMREGENLRNDLLARIANVEGIKDAIAARAPESVALHNEKLKARVSELLGEVRVDEARLLNECAILADKQDITEELTRLSSHIMQFRQILSEATPVGRKLDFLVQEINREVNTCGSKANDTEMAKRVIEAKCEIEKIREQIQNLE